MEIIIEYALSYKLLLVNLVNYISIMNNPFLTLSIWLITFMCYSQSENLLLPDNRSCAEVFNDSISKNGFYIPSNIDECNKELDKLFGSKAKCKLVEASDVELKRIMGVYILDEWTEQESTRLCCYFIEKGINSDEDRDYLILLSYKRHLLKQDFDINTECNKILLHHDSIAKERKIRDENNIIADSINGIYIPENLDDCLLILNQLLNGTIKDEIKNAENIVGFHFGLGMWIRNNWGLWGGSRLQLWFNNQGLNNPDDISGLILSVYQEYLQKGFIDTREKLTEVKKEYEKIAQEMLDRSPDTPFLEFSEDDYYSDEYKDFLKDRHIDGIFISR